VPLDVQRIFLGIIGPQSPVFGRDTNKRRSAMKKILGITGLVLMTALSLPALAQDKVWHHGQSAMGEPKYPEGFAHFDYVNVDARRAARCGWAIWGATTPSTRSCRRARRRAGSG
jgi:hypothetical protein